MDVQPRRALSSSFVLKLNKVATEAKTVGTMENGEGRIDGRKMKFLVITGGTMSGLGKGTVISSIGEGPCFSLFSF